MNCPRCDLATKVVKTSVTADGKDRLRTCTEHGNFWSSETFKRWLTVAQTVTGNHGQAPVAPVAPIAPAPTGEQRPPPATTGNPLSSDGGVGGGLSSGQSLSGQEADQASSKPSDARAMDYPAAFEAEWSATNKTGSKFKAWKAWSALGKPRFSAAWAEWSKLDSWRRGFVPHVVTWLNDRRFQQEPAEVPKVDTRQAVPFAVAAEDSRRDRHVAARLDEMRLEQLARAGGAK